MDQNRRTKPTRDGNAFRSTDAAQLTSPIGIVTVLPRPQGRRRSLGSVLDVDVPDALASHGVQLIEEVKSKPTDDISVSSFLLDRDGKGHQVGEKIQRRGNGRLFISFPHKHERATAVQCVSQWFERYYYFSALKIASATPHKMQRYKKDRSFTRGIFLKIWLMRKTNVVTARVTGDITGLRGAHL